MSRREVADMVDRMFEEGGLAVDLAMMHTREKRKRKRLASKKSKPVCDIYGPTGPKFVKACAAFLPEMAKIFDEAHALVRDDPAKKEVKDE
jgi:hypothetical protein